MEFTQFDERIAEGMLGAATAAGGISAILTSPRRTRSRQAHRGDGRPNQPSDAVREPARWVPLGVRRSLLGRRVLPGHPERRMGGDDRVQAQPPPRPVSGGVCVATAEIISLTKRSGVARIDITNDGAAVCAAEGTVTIVAPRG